MSKSNPPYPSLMPRHVLVWRIDTAENMSSGAEQILTEDERRRAADTSNAAGRRQYIIIRAALRKILGHYTGRPPDQVELRYGAHQKPAVSMPPGAKPLYFSLTHTRDMALIALTAIGEVGIDVEYARRRLHDLDALIDRALTPPEARAVRVRPTLDQSALFLRYWTAKEACLKAAGTGLFHGANAAVITMHTHDRATGTMSQGANCCSPRAGRPESSAKWQVKFFHPAQNYIGALAFRADMENVRLIASVHGS